MNTINVENCKTLLIGRRGENEVTTVAFDFTEWASEFGSGVVDLYVKRFGDDSAYPVVLTIDGTVASWLVTETDTNVAGYGKAEYVYRVDGKIAKSAVFSFFVAEDIGQPASEPPDPYESWLEQLTALGAETEAHAQAAEQSAEDAAESAEDAAQSATNAEGYAGQAETAAGLAQAAQTASEAARDAAQTAQASAESSATAASGSAASAASSATAAAGSASDASASASAASASATTASNAATQAEAAKTAAQTAQSAAEDAAEDAQQAAQQAHVEYEQLSGEVDDLSDEVAQQKSAIDDLSALVDRKAGMLVDTASSAIASFTPDATIPDLLGVSVDINPVQDLHGFDHPWPGGGGKNLFQTTATTGTVNGTTFTVNDDGTIRVSGTPSAIINGVYVFGEVTLPAGTYKNNGNDSPTNALRITVYNVTASTSLASIYNGYDISFTLSEESVVRVYPFVHTNYDGSAITMKPMIRLASVTDATYAPYSNICPISGWDAVEVEATGINIWDEEWELGGLVNATGLPYNATDRIRSKNFCGCKPSTAFFKCSDDVHVNVFWYDSNKVFISRDAAVTNSVITSPSNAAFFKLVDTDRINYADNISINYPATDHAYHPYAGNRYTIALGQTVYGGTLDATAGTLTVDRAMVTVTDADDITKATNPDGFLYYVYGKAPGARNSANQMCDRLKYAQSGAAITLYAADSGFVVYQTSVVYFKINKNIDTVDAMRSYLSNQGALQFVYDLATPITIDLDPVTISTIAGQTNNVWSDAGDVSVEFAADLKHYIDNKIAAAVAALS